MLFIFCRRIVMLSLPVMLVLATGPAQAYVPVQGTDQLNTAMQRFVSQLELRKAQHILPLLSNSEDAVVLEALWNLPVMIGTSPYRASDLPVLMDMIQQQAQVSKTYVLFAPQADKAPDITSNSTVFQDEISRSSVAMLGLIAAALEAGNDFTSDLTQQADHKTRLAALVKLRRGLVQVISTTILMLHNPELKPHNQALITTALADYGSAMTTGISLQERQIILSVLNDAQSGLSEAARAASGRFITQLERKDCSGLCAQQ